ncbi:MAG: ABC transporter ATP-binding protein [bacterium]
MRFSLNNWFSSFRSSFRDTLLYTKRSLGLAWKSSPRMSVLIVFLTLISAVMPLGVAYVGKVIIDSVLSGSVESTINWVLVEAGVIALQALVQRALFLYRTLLGARLALDVNVLILEKALTLELRHFEDSEVYDKLTQARREASSRPVSMAGNTMQLAQNILTLLGYITLLVSFSGWAVLGLLLAAFPATIAEMRYSRKGFRLRNWRSPDARRLNYVEYVLANDAHVKEVKVLNLGPMLLQRYKDLGEAFYAEDKELSVKRSLWSYVLSLLATVAFYATYLVMAIATAAGQLTLGNLTLYVAAFRQGQQSFQSCLTAIGSMYEDNLYMSNLFSFLEIPTTRAEQSDTAPVSHKSFGQEKGIRFDHVGFRYPGNDEWAVRNISLFIPEGQSMALVGHNGAGKTTFIKLLCRLYEPTEGRIFLDGKNLNDWDELVLQQRISVVFQDYNKYQFKVRENVGIGSVEHMGDEERIWRAAELGGVEEVVADLPDGLDTQLGKWFKDGTELSGGQWQKIALSRAFMREDADILIFDEPTAALDAEAEQLVFERFRTLAKGKTAILISHRFPTVRMAERIVVVEGGRIVEEGSHDDLLRKGGRYAELFSLQAKGYL